MVARADSDDALLVVSPIVTSTIEGTHHHGGGDEIPETPPPYAVNTAAQSNGLEDDDELLQVADAAAVNMGASLIAPAPAAAARAPSDPFFAELGQEQAPSPASAYSSGSSVGAAAAALPEVPSAAVPGYSGYGGGSDGAVEPRMPGAAAASGARAAAPPASSQAPAPAAATAVQTGAMQAARPLTFAGGVLPDDFLRVMVPVEVPINTPRAGPGAAAMGGGAGNMYGVGAGGAGDEYLMGGFSEGTVTIHVTQARLAKNYGFTSMDPAVHLTIGGLQARTAVCSNGSKTPYWNQRLVFPGVLAQEQRLKVEIFDIGTFSDNLVAWGTVDITAAMAGATPMENWFPLSGKQGPGKEGVIHMHVSFKNSGPAPRQSSGRQFVNRGPMIPQLPSHRRQQPPPQQQQRQQAPPADVSQLKDMFPGMDEDILREVLASKQGNAEEAINTLLAMC